LIALLIVVVVGTVIAELDWRLVFPAEMGVSHSKDPMFFSTAFRDATMLHYMNQENGTIETALRAMYRSVGREDEWNMALRMVRR